MKAQVTEDIQREVISSYHEWQFPEMNGPDLRVWRSNAHLLRSNAPPYEPALVSCELSGLLYNMEKTRLSLSGERCS